MNTLEVQQISYAYGRKKILSEVSFCLESGRNIYVLGPNGVGKSTLFRCILGHLKAQQGKVLINKQAIETYTAKELAQKVAYIPQSCKPTFNYTVLQLALMGRAGYLGAFSTPSAKDYEMAYEILARLGIVTKAQCGIDTISGGERQLAMIARALVQEAEILIMDEPTNSLDYGNQIRIQTQMKQLSESGLLILQSSHNPQYALFFADEVMVLHGGKLIAKGEPKRVLQPEVLEQIYGIKVSIQDNILLPQINF